MAKMLTVGLSVAKCILRRGKKNDNNDTMAVTKSKTGALKKLRLWLGLPLLCTLIIAILTILMIFAGSKPGMMEDTPVFTLNVSRIGQAIHQKIDGEIASWNFDDLHINLKRSAPIEIPSTITAAPTTLITMAPRGVGSVFESLTGKAGDNLESANSAAHSKASSVKSKASSAAHSAVGSIESSVNNGLDQTAKKLKGKVTELVDDGFEKIRAELDLQGFYSIYVMTTCDGDYVKGDGKDAKEHMKVNKCEKNSALNPMKWVSVFYWASFNMTCIGLCFELKAIHVPEKKWFNWTVVFLVASSFTLAMGSALAHGIADNTARLTDFLGAGLGIDGIAGNKFIAMTWATTIFLLVNVALVYFFNWYIGRHPEAASKASSGPSGGLPFKISNPIPTAAGHNRGGSGGGATELDNMVRNTAAAKHRSGARGSMMGDGDQTRYDRTYDTPGLFDRNAGYDDGAPHGEVPLPSAPKNAYADAKYRPERPSREGGENRYRSGVSRG